MNAGPVDTARDLVDVSHHMFYLPDYNYHPRDYRPPLNGLIAVHPGAAVVFTGIHSGVVAVTVEARQTPPDEVSTAGWDEVVEVSLEAPLGHVMVIAPMAMSPDQPELPALTAAGPGHYRVRIHACGRDIAPDLVAHEPVEEYLIMVWPSPAASEIVYKQTDAYGAQQRRSAAEAPPVLSRPETALERHQRMVDETLRRESARARQAGKRTKE